MSLTMAVSIGNIIGSGIYNNSLKINLGEKKRKKNVLGRGRDYGERKEENSATS